MRLTLRTLLAYLDDTLDPAEIKEIGQKVAESDTAQELIARIKQVTRRRRLTTPPATGPGARFDANTVAEYLDSVLPAEQVAEVEKVCLESDVHLAEIAACHQILTLVLGEPALVPPTARQRMYALVQGREAVARRPRRRAPAAASTAAGADGSEADETLLLGLPPFGRAGRRARWLVPAVAALLLVALGVALWMALRTVVSRDPEPAVAVSRPPAGERAVIPGVPSPKVPDKEQEPQPLAPDKKQDKPVPSEPKAEESPKQPSEPEKPKEKEKETAPPSVAAAVPKPSTERRDVGTPILDLKRIRNTMNMLLQQPRDKGSWQRLRPEIDRVYTDDLLLVLPGYRSEIRLDNRIHLLLWGNVEQLLYLPLFESAVRLHAVPADQPDAPEVDFTLERGRVIVSNQKNQPARVRVRFHNEVWDLTLQEGGTEVGLELIGRQESFETSGRPLAFLSLVVLRGQAQLRIGHFTHTLQAPVGGQPAPAVFSWDNRSPGARGPFPLPQVPLLWDERLPPNWQWENLPPREQEIIRQNYDNLLLALDELNRRLTDSKTKVSVVLAENVHANRPMTRQLAVLSLGALDELGYVLDALADKQYQDVRDAAVWALRHWLGRQEGQDQKLRQALLEKRYSDRQTDTLMQLLHIFSEEDRAKKETYQTLIEYLRHDQPAVRQLAYWHLSRLVPEAKIPYDPAGGEKQRQAAYLQWMKLLEEGKLPPPRPASPMPMPPR
ncbi:MAG TPA: hypothetical protein VNK04_20365 [Gemmataceae bacterium]|nr:hypothetical protein [Gemmataceae bacterium]